MYQLIGITPGDELVPSEQRVIAVSASREELAERIESLQADSQKWRDAVAGTSYDSALAQVFCDFEIQPLMPALPNE